jgi:hypothetical protein
MKMRRKALSQALRYAAKTTRPHTNVLCLVRFRCTSGYWANPLALLHRAGRCVRLSLGDGRFPISEPFVRRGVSATSSESERVSRTTTTWNLVKLSLRFCFIVHPVFLNRCQRAYEPLQSRQVKNSELELWAAAVPDIIPSVRQIHSVSMLLVAKLVVLNVPPLQYAETASVNLVPVDCFSIRCWVDAIWNDLKPCESKSSEMQDISKLIHNHYYNRQCLIRAVTLFISPNQDCK